MKPIVVLIGLHLTLLIVPPASTTVIDLTTKIDAIGSEVVDAVISKIRHSLIFPDDYNLLRRLAYVQTEFGGTKNIPTGDGGLWAISPSVFESTKTLPPTLRQVIIEKFSIDLPTLTLSDCRQPLISALTALVHIEMERSNVAHIQTVRDQAIFLSEIGLLGTFTVDDYVTQALLMEGPQLCANDLDLIVVIGGSRSPNSSFQVTTPKEIDFVSKLFAFQSRPYVRLGLVAMTGGGDEVDVRLELDNLVNGTEFEKIIQDTGIAADDGVDGQTFVNDQLKVAVDLVKKSERRPGVPVVFIIFLNKNSTQDLTNMALVEGAGIKTIVISIGQPQTTEHESELMQLSQNLKQNIFTPYDPSVDSIGVGENGLSQLDRRLKPDLCKTHRKLEVDSENYVEITLPPKEFINSAFFEVDVLPGHDFYFVDIQAHAGLVNVEGSLSFSQQEKWPSSAMYDERLINCGQNKVNLSMVGDDDGDDGKKIYFVVTNSETNGFIMMVNVSVRTTPSDGGLRMTANFFVINGLTFWLLMWNHFVGF